MSIVCLVLVSNTNADINTQSFEESQQQEKTLKASEGFGDFVDQYFLGQGVGRLVNTKENTHEMQKVTPHRRTRVKSIKAEEREFRQPSGYFLRECLEDALEFGRFRRRMDVEDEAEKDEDYPDGFVNSFIDVDYHESDHEYDDDGNYDDYDNDDEEDEYLQHSMPSWLNSETFEDIHRRLQTCDIPTQRSLRVSKKLCCDP